MQNVGHKISQARLVFSHMLAWIWDVRENHWPKLPFSELRAVCCLRQVEKPGSKESADALWAEIEAADHGAPQELDREGSLKIDV